MATRPPGTSPRDDASRHRGPHVFGATEQAATFSGRLEPRPGSGDPLGLGSEPQERTPGDLMDLSIAASTFGNLRMFDSL